MPLLHQPHVLSESTNPDLFRALTHAGNDPDPYPTYERIRRDYPVAEIFGTIHLTRYADVDRVLRDPRVSSDDRNSVVHRQLEAGNQLGVAYLSQMDTRSFLHRDPPDHTRLRRLVTRGLAAHRFEALRPFIEGMLNKILDSALPAGRLDIVEDLASPLPIAVISELLGVPVEDRSAIASWPRAQLCCSFEPASVVAAAEVARSDASERRQVEADRIQAQLTDYFSLLIERRRDDPGDDLISALIAAEEQGDQLSEEELNATLRLLFISGYETTSNVIGNGVLALTSHPDQWTALRDNPLLAGGAIDEVLRYDAPFQFTRRIALADLEIDGYAVKAGQTLFLWLAAANRDPAVFERPDSFDIRRSDNRHLAFGAGIHACIGVPLARMQAEIVFTALIHRLSEPKVEVEPTYLTDAFRALKSLPITFSDVTGARLSRIAA